VDARRLVSLESFKAAHCREVEEDDADSYDGSASEAEEDDEWLFAEDRKRKGKGKEPAKKKPRKKVKPVEDEDMEDWESSAKIDKLCEILEAVRANDPTDKVIVFSQVLPTVNSIDPSSPDSSISFNQLSKLGISVLEGYFSPCTMLIVVRWKYGSSSTCGRTREFPFRSFKDSLSRFPSRRRIRT
jgi:hypothetical protein